MSIRATMQIGHDKSTKVEIGYVYQSRRQCAFGCIYKSRNWICLLEQAPSTLPTASTKVEIGYVYQRQWEELGNKNLQKQKLDMSIRVRLVVGLARQSTKVEIGYVYQSLSKNGVY